MADPFVMSFRFQGDGSQLKAASAEARKDITSVGGAAAATANDLDTHTQALTRETAAVREAAAANRELAAAEIEARDRVARALGTTLQPVERKLPTNLSGFESAAQPTADNQRAIVAATTSQQNALRGLGAEVAATRQESVLYRAELDAVRARYNPLFAASQQYEQELRDIAEAERLGALSAMEAARAREVAAAQIAPATALVRDHTGAIKLDTWEARNLSYQMNDVFQSLILGMPPTQVLLQQGPQITQIYGGVGRTFRALTQALTPMRVGLGLAAVSVIALGTAYNSYLRSTKEVQTASEGLGRAVTGTAAEMEAAARAGAAAAGISVSAARAMQSSFLRTGRIGAENFEALIGLSKDFSTTMGLTAEAGREALTELFADPANAADELYNKYGLIDGAVARQVSQLAGQNRLIEAQARLLEALPDRLVDAADATTLLGRAWQGVATGASSAFDWIGRTIDRALSGPELDEQITDLQARLARAEQVAGTRAASRHNVGDIEELRAELAALQAIRDQRDARNNRSEASQRGAAALRIADGAGVNARGIEAERLRNELATLQGGLAAPDLDEVQRDRITRAIEATSAALDALNARKERQAALDRIEIALINERNPLVRAELEGRRALLEAEAGETTAAERAAAAQRARNRVIEETIAGARAQASDLRGETEVRARLAAQVAAGTLTAEEANTVLQQELQLRPLIAAAALAEGAEKTRLKAVIQELQSAYVASARVQRQTDAATSVRDYLRGQSEKLEMLRLEAALLGESEATRTRLLALAEAEQKIRQMRLDPAGALADAMRQQAFATAEATRELERQIDTWRDLQSAGEDAIDGALDALRSGDIRGALSELAADISDTIFELGVGNPIKNALLGTDHGTFDDLGGFAGIWDRLTGKTPAVPTISTQSMATGAMHVTAASVVINGGITGALPGAAANLTGAAGGAGIGSDVARQVWEYFGAKGLAPHQIAGILGNVSAESAFNPLAVGDGGTSFGLFQHHAERGQGLLSSLGGIGNLGDIKGQLEYVWQELLTGENGVLKQLLAATDVTQATQAFVGFERPSGWSAANPMGALGWTDRLGAAQSAMDTFSQSAIAATGNLGTLGGGFETFGTALQQAIAGGMTGGGTGSLLSLAIGGVGSLLGIPGFANGGPTGGSDPTRVAGVVHEEEFVFDAGATRRIGVGNLEALRRGTLRGYADGGHVSSIGPRYAPALRPEPAPRSPLQRDDQPVRVELLVQPSGEFDFRTQQVARGVTVDMIRDYDRNVAPATYARIASDPRRVG
ncbi:phage tail tip lysozyme [Maritimibacter alkaliphilus]|uniref:phage tail tip lysozyme n=1 Tax=Maritimibacter alkaliphilus TaxID=404236 RepID=UPI001C98419B|nr:phage tail length tape measure family protein [Maritimibacter alkaliphilus]